MQKIMYNIISKKIAQRIFNGIYPANQPLPSIRKLADEFHCNPNTMQRALKFLSNQNLIYSERTIGYYVSDNITIQDCKQNAALKSISIFLNTMHNLGFNDSEILSLLQDLNV